MKATIRVKIFAWISALTLLFVLLTILLTTLFYKPFYLKKQERLFRDLCTQLTGLYAGDRESFAGVTANLEYTRGFRIALYLTDEGRIEEGNPERPAPPPREPEPMDRNDTPRFPLPDPLIGEIIRLEGRGEYVFKKMISPQMGSFALTMFYRIDGNTFLLVTRPMESIDENIATTNRFALLTGLFFFLFGIGAAFFMSKFITRPVNELKSIAESMCELDFSRKYEGRSRDELGELGQSINSLSDQLSRAMERLNRLNTNLLLEIEKERKIDEMRQTFIANVSHELRTPISLIEGYAEGLLDNVNEDGAKRISYCEVIIDETRKMEKHVGDLLSLSQIQSGVVPLEYTRFPVAGLLGDTAGKFEKEAEKRGFRIIVEPPGPLEARADRNRAEQVLTNYMANALNYGGGERIIRLSAEPVDGGRVRLSLFNSGSPVDESIKERIWESYYKADKSRARREGGYGLGLSIVRAIQEQHGNPYGLENRPDGVTFWFELDR